MSRKVENESEAFENTAMVFSPRPLGANKALISQPLYHLQCWASGANYPLDHLFISLHPSSNAPKALRKGGISSIKGNQQGTTIQTLHPLTGPLGTGRSLIRRTFHPSTNPGETKSLGRPSITSWYQEQPRSHWRVRNSQGRW